MASQLDIIVSADIAEATSALSKVGAAAEREMTRVSGAQARAKAEGERFISGLQRQVETFNMSGSALLAYQAKLKGVSDQAQPLIDRLERMKSAASAFNQTAAQLHAGGFEDIAKGAEHAATASSGMTREAIVLAHELSQGNFSRFGGSLLVMAEYSEKATKALGLLVGPIGFVVGAVGLFALAVYEGAKASDEFRRSLQLTGNFAGTTEGQVTAMAHSIASSTTASIATAREALTSLVATGEVGPKVLGPMALAVAAVAKNTHEGADKIAVDFAKMGDGAAKWAVEHNKAWNFISGDQYAYIKSLEEQGRKTEAQIVLLDAVNSHMKQLPENLGYAQKRWRELGEAAGQAWDLMMGVGRADTLDEKLAKVDARIAKQLQQSTSGVSYPGSAAGAPTAVAGQGLTNDLMEKASLLAKKAQEASKAAADSAEGDRHKQQLAAIDARDRWREETKGVSLANRELEKYRTLTVAPLKGTANEISAAEQAATEAAIRKKYNPGADNAAKKLDTRYSDRLQSLTDEGIKLDAETANFLKYGKAIDTSRVAVLELEIAQGKLKGLDSGRIATLHALAEADDTKAQAFEAEKTAAAYEKETRAIEAAANAQAMNARQTRIAADLEKLRGNQALWSEERYKALAAARTVAITAEYDNRLTQQLAEQQRSVNDDVAKLDLETASIGMSTVARQKLVAALVLQKQAEKDIAANPAATAQILDAMVTKQNQLTDAIQRNYDAQRTWSAGAKSALQEYEEDATNAAASTKKLFDDAFHGLEDTLLQFEQTGKLSFKSLGKALQTDLLQSTNKDLISSGLNYLKGGISGGTGLGGVLSDGAKSLFGVDLKKMLPSSLGAGSGRSGEAAAIEGTTNAMSTLTAAAYAAARGLGGVGGGAASAASLSSGGLWGGIGKLFGLGGASYTGATSGNALGGWSGAVDSSNIAAEWGMGLAVGTNFVPYDGFKANLHKGEAVVPAAYNPHAGGKGSARPLSVTIHQNFTGTVSRQTANQAATAAAQQLQLAHARNG